jgi:hypothetical protein
MKLAEGTISVLDLPVGMSAYGNEVTAIHTELADETITQDEAQAMLHGALIRFAKETGIVYIAEKLLL